MCRVALPSHRCALLGTAVHYNTLQHTDLKNTFVAMNGSDVRRSVALAVTLATVQRPPALCCSVSQCVAVCCSVLQCVAVSQKRLRCHPTITYFFVYGIQAMR